MVHQIFILPCHQNLDMAMCSKVQGLVHPHLHLPLVDLFLCLLYRTWSAFTCTIEIGKLCRISLSLRDVDLFLFLLFRILLEILHIHE